MKKIIMYEKPTCTKCRQAVKFLKERKIDFERVDYYKEPFTKQRLKELLMIAKLSPRDVLRTSEKIYRKLGIARKDYSDDKLIELMVRYPDLLQRPIVVKGRRGVLARPTENLEELL